MSSGPIWDAYADAALAHQCPCCGAAPQTWCTNEITGRVRRVPCLARILAAEPAPARSVTAGCAECGRLPLQAGGALCDFCANYARQEVMAAKLREDGRRHRQESL